jgi:hypothetical protein
MTRATQNTIGYMRNQKAKRICTLKKIESRLIKRKKRTVIILECPVLGPVRNGMTE